MKIHILGAPGSGVTTLGRALAGHLQAKHLDTDDYHWFTDDPLPYRRRRNPEHRMKLLMADLALHQNWVLSGALCGWGDALIPQFERVVYVWAPAEIRLARIRERERLRYGEERIGPGGDLNLVFEKFCAWAEAYDRPGDNLRSRGKELAWLEALPCPVIKVEEVHPTDKIVLRLMELL